MQLKLKCHYPEVTVPTRGHASDAGLDLTAYRVEQKTETVFLFDTGISVQPETGFYTEVVPRSSLMKTSFMLANSVGIIDPDYRGRILVPLRYLGAGDGLTEAQALLGQRIAQLLIRRLEPCTVEVVDELDDSVRGTGGFGSTGTH